MLSETCVSPQHEAVQTTSNEPISIQRLEKDTPDFESLFKESRRPLED